jgi:hypothetical protein
VRSQLNARTLGVNRVFHRGINVDRFTIELGDGSVFATCECCGAKSPSVVGYVHREDDAFAAYYAGWTEGHRGTRISLIIGVGRWDDDATPADRRSFGLRCWLDGGEIRFEVEDPASSRYGTNTFLGAMLARSAALADPEISAVLHAAEHIAQDDPRVRAALEDVAA